MYSPQIAVLINHTTNRIGSALSSKRETYRYLTRIIPTCKPRKISYIKKQSKKKEEEDANIEMLAKNLELSQREIKYYYASEKLRTMEDESTGFKR